MKENWQIKKLVEVCEKTSNINWVNNSKKEYKYIDLSAVSRETLQINGHQYINSENAPSRAKKIVLNNDVIFATTRPTLKRATIINNDFHGHICSTGFSVLRPKNDEALSKYVFYTLLTDSFMIYVEKLQKGASYPAITDNEVKAYRIPIPPIPEQKRIVKILDEAFAAIDKAKANAEKNLQNSRELFDSYLNKVFANPGEDWEEKKLGDVCNIIGGGTPAKSTSEYYTGNIPWATVRDMKFDVLATTEFCITKKAIKESSSNLIPRNNVIIATRVGLGKVCILSNDTAINQDLKGILPKKKNGLDTSYLFYWFKSISKIIEANGVGATVKGVKIPFIESLKIPFPNLFAQKQIVNNLDGISSETKKLENIYQQKLSDLEELKKSILQKAFEGQLTIDNG